MKLIPLLVLLNLIVGISVSYAQKLKKNAMLVKYVLPPSDTSYVNKKFAYKVIDNNYDANNKLRTFTFQSGNISIAGKTPKYCSSFRYLKDFTSQKLSSLDYANAETRFSYMEVNIDAIQQLPNRQIQTNNIKENGKVIGQIHNYELQFTLAKSLHFFNQDEQLFFESNGNEVVTTTFLFPRDFALPNNQRLSGCSSIAQLNLMIADLHATITKQAKEKIVETWSRSCFQAIYSAVNETKAHFTYPMGYIKLNKKAGHPEFLEGMEIMETIKDSIKANFKKKNAANWHSKGIQELARQSNAIWEKILKFEKEDANGGILTPAMTTWITKNWIWNQFLLGEMNIAIITAEDLLSKEKSESYKDVSHLEAFIDFAVDYKRRYNLNAIKYGWQ